ncbi:uncharacterized protein LOC107615324 [Arachis ipaensis]|uniref:uncharacterized protein LOC107615324 n=1 Tax=Arachis ipaensis TaxID=130454 RepID=UPI0007AF9F46|nr:uncharacterized protein LOC107615324 [Arachis ipaensis]
MANDHRISSSVIFIGNDSTTWEQELKTSILQKVGLCGSKWVRKVFYKIPIAVVSTGVQYKTFVIGSNEDMQVLFYCRRSFLEVRIHELYAKLEDGVDSSGASAPNPQSMMVGGASTSMPVVAAGGLLVEPLSVPPMAARSPGLIPALFGEDPTFGGQGLHEGNPSGEFQIVQSFQTKEEAVLSVKDYSIRRGVQYRVMESDHLKFHGRCNEFGNGCTWLIRITLRQRKVNWEVRRYSGPHTCLATSISSDHRQLDHHVICARIFSLVRADAAVTIKVLQEATEATYGFRLSYRKVWMAKQKAVAQIYGDWKESYAELPRWILGVQATMEGTVALLNTSPVRVGDHVDESTRYFHRIFWTFPPCIEAFRHCKPLVSIDGTHLYGKYGRNLLLAIVQYGNSNILPVAFALMAGENAEHNGIKAALEATDSAWLPPHAYRVYFIQHVATNFALSFKDQDARRLLVNAAYAKTEAEFDY